jgi:hypothetical protein
VLVPAVAAADCAGQRVRVDVAVPGTVANRLQLSIPAGHRQPDFDFDVRLLGGRQRRSDATERRHIRQRGASTSAGLGQSAGCDGCRRRNVPFDNFAEDKLSHVAASALLTARNIPAAAAISVFISLTPDSSFLVP